MYMYSYIFQCTHVQLNFQGGSIKKNHIYLSTPRCREIVENNAEKVKIINTGVKSFARADNKGSDCDYRIAQEGALSIIPFIQKRKVTAEREDIVKLLHASDIDKPPEISSFSEIFQKRLESIATGSIIYLFKGTYILISKSECGNVLDDSGL